jgi:hypothetical protein
MIANRIRSKNFLSQNVTPNPTPDWLDNISLSPCDSNTVQIQGIDTPIVLFVDVIYGLDGGTLTVGVNTTNAYGGTITTVNATPPPTFTVNPNEYVTFRYINGFGTIIFDVYNQSDSNTILDSGINLTVDIP